MRKIKIKLSNLGYHIVYWIIVVIVLSVVFGRSWGSNISAFFFVTMLLPVVLGTSYFFNYFLVPRYFLKHKHLKFTLYTFYLIVVSLYLEIIVLLFSFIYFSNYSIHNMGPNAHATLLLAVVMYLLVFLGSFLILARQIKENQQMIVSLISEKEKNQVQFLEVISNRKQTRIPFDNITYIESLADYVIIHSSDKEIKSKEKISNLESLLPDEFIRIHRSFIINKSKVTSVSTKEVMIADKQLNIGRSYKNSVIESLEIS